MIPRLDTRRSEKAIQDEILRFLATAPGVTAWKQGTGAFRATHKGRERFVQLGKAGTPDILGFRERHLKLAVDPGDESMIRVAQFLAIEVKRPGEPVTPLQEAFLYRVHRAGGIACVATCVKDVAIALGMTP